MLGMRLAILAVAVVLVVAGCLQAAPGGNVTPAGGGGEPGNGGTGGGETGGGGAPPSGPVKAACSAAEAPSAISAFHYCQFAGCSDPYVVEDPTTVEYLPAKASHTVEAQLSGEGSLIAGFDESVSFSRIIPDSGAVFLQVDGSIDGKPFKGDVFGESELNLEGAQTITGDSAKYDGVLLKIESATIKTGSVKVTGNFDYGGQKYASGVFTGTIKVGRGFTRLDAGTKAFEGILTITDTSVVLDGQRVAGNKIELSGTMSSNFNQLSGTVNQVVIDNRPQFASTLTPADASLCYKSGSAFTAKTTVSASDAYAVDVEVIGIGVPVGPRIGSWSGKDVYGLEVGDVTPGEPLTVSAQLKPGDSGWIVVRSDNSAPVIIPAEALKA
jgi:hypothetical protein